MPKVAKFLNDWDCENDSHRKIGDLLETPSIFKYENRENLEVRTISRQDLQTKFAKTLNDYTPMSLKGQEL